jgi:hypothetical protein
MSYHESFQAFYKVGTIWAKENADILNPLKADPIRLEATVREIFNREGFIETMFQSLSARLYRLCFDNPEIVEQNFVDGVCDTISSDTLPI